MGKFSRLPICNQVLSTYDISHVPGSPLSFRFFVHAQGEPGNKAKLLSVFQFMPMLQLVVHMQLSLTKWPTLMNI